MPRRKLQTPQARAKAHAKRADGLKKQALELAMLCAVPVGLVCAGAPPLRWESEEGVLERYRRAVPPEARAGHTHWAYLETELAKRRAKLARERHGCPAALPDWDGALNDMTLDEARDLLEALDAALRATGNRMEALGLPADRGHGHGALDEQVASDSSDDAVMQQHLGHDGGVPWTGGDPVDMADAEGFQQLQMAPYDGGNSDGLLEQFPREHGFQMQPGCGGGNYSGSSDDGMLALGLRLANADYNNSGGGDGMLALGLATAGYNYSGGGDGMLALGRANAGYNNSGAGDRMLELGLTNAGYDYSGGGDQTRAPGFGNAGYNWPDLTMWHTDEVCDAAMRHGYYPGFADGTPAPEHQHHSAEVATGGDYGNALPSGYGYPMAMAMGVGDNFTSLESNHTAAHWQAEAFQHSDTSTSTGELLSAASSPRYLY